MSNNFSMFNITSQHDATLPISPVGSISYVHIGSANMFYYLLLQCEVAASFISLARYPSLASFWFDAPGIYGVGLIGYFK